MLNLQSLSISSSYKALDFFREQKKDMEEHLSIYGSEYPLKNYEK